MWTWLIQDSVQRLAHLLDYLERTRGDFAPVLLIHPMTNQDTSNGWI
jgi:hypothetical protein